MRCHGEGENEGKKMYKNAVGSVHVVLRGLKVVCNQGNRKANGPKKGGDPTNSKLGRRNDKRQ